MPTLHLIANAHLDPVWLWDWREGLTEGVTTCRTILDLMDEDPDFTFIRGEAAIYAHIEEFAPDVFARIQTQIEAGRWEVVGGNWIQPDTNLSSTETLCRHFHVGRAYFQSHFGFAPSVAWAADSFGHSAGLPEILVGMGMDSLAFFRPDPRTLTLEKPAFWWQASSGARVLGYRSPAAWYGCERPEIAPRLDEAVEQSAQSDVRNVGVFYGMGNHGGGPTRRMLRDIRAWKDANPEVEVVHSGLGRLFEALREEAQIQGDDWFPTHQGELNFCLRGCYSSAFKTKKLFRQAEVAATQAETMATLVGTSTKAKLPRADAVWQSVLFNSFHDILPGTSIERALDTQNNELGGALFEAQRIELRALNVLSSRVDTQVPEVEGDVPKSTPFLIWNPLPRAFSGLVELECSLDYRPVFDYAGRDSEVPLEVRDANGEVLAWQRIAHESNFFAMFPWRARVVVPMQVPALGWSVASLGWVEDATVMVPNASVKAENDAIENAFFRVQAGDELKIFHHNRELFVGGLKFQTIRDEWGAWGGMSEEPESLDLSEVLHEWKLEQFEVLERGPLRARLWTRWTGGDSHLDLIFVLDERETVEVEVRLLWNERAARLKMHMNAGISDATFDVPGATVTRGELGHVPGGRWVSTSRFGFASDAIYDFDIKDGALRATLARATRYASDRKLTADEEPWRPVMDRGELKMRFLIAPPEQQNLAQHARELLSPPLALAVSSTKGEWPKHGSLGELAPDSIELLALGEDDDGLFLRARETAGTSTHVRWTFGGQTHDLSEIGAHQIKTWRLNAELKN